MTMFRRRSVVWTVCRGLLMGVVCVYVMLALDVINLGSNKPQGDDRKQRVVDGEGDVEARDNAVISHNGRVEQEAEIKNVELSQEDYMTDFGKTLERHADSEKNIILVYFDASYIDMVHNFLEVSIRKHNISNILLMSSTRRDCQLINTDTACHVVQSVFHNDSPDTPCKYGSQACKDKMNIRTDMIIQTLELGYNVLHSDADVIFLQNPITMVTQECPKDTCHSACLYDYHNYNAGFIYLRASEGALWLYNEMKTFALAHPNIDDQTILNKVVKRGLAKHMLKHKVFDRRYYLSGKNYFEPDNYFPGDRKCNGCIVVHDNWIVGYPAKVYRLREHLFWMYDGGSQYYSSRERKYLTYTNTYHHSNSSTMYNLEMDALKNALTLAFLLNRTVIVPKFHCDKSIEAKCTLLYVTKIITLEQHFPDSYREHMFLSHPKVPKLSTNNKPYLIANNLYNNKITPKDVNIFHPQNSETGSTEHEVLEWFGKETSDLLIFHSLYGPVTRLSDANLQIAFSKRLNALSQSGYKHYKI